ncbi:serine protease [Archangium violaceum]|uniref:S1 family serine peptidase n=1 Tax=Archangium violaceum TaxID=83451 RepID=UPI002B31223C|nr:serine protease [Archangium gephyra]
MKQRMLLAALVSASLITGCGEPTDEVPTEQQPAVEATGQTEQEIIGGAYAYQNQFPYQVRILVDGGTWCGGSLIKPNWVLTAGHCVDGIDPSRITVVAGDHTISGYESTEQTQTVYGHAKHPYFQYISGAPVYDVAVILLNGSFWLNGAVQTIALPTGPAPLTAMTASGWGWPWGGAYSASNQLKYANLPVNSVSACDGWLARNLYAGLELCVGYSNGIEGGCHGDSGGPLAYGGRVYGVVSWGRGVSCDSYTAFADVSSHVSWIQSYTGP